MKICHIVSHIDEEASGPSYSVPMLCNSISTLGNEVTLTTLSSRGIRPRYDLINHKEFISTNFLKKLGISNEMKKWFSRNINEYSFIHSHGLWMMPNIYPATFSNKYNKNYIISPRGTLSKNAMVFSKSVKNIFWYSFQKRALDRATAFHATSEDEYNDIRSLGFKAPVAIIPNGIEIPNEVIIPQKSRPNKKLLYLGRIHPKKGLEMAINAWSKLEHLYPNWSFNIVGKGEDAYIKSLKNLVKVKNINRVEFFGPLYGEDKQKIFQDSDLFILPTKSENFGMVVAESLSNSTPVITTKGAPWKDLKTHNAGWWVDISENELELALKDAMNMSGELLQGMGRNGKEWMKKDFSWDMIGKEMTNFYNWLENKEDKPTFVRID